MTMDDRNTLPFLFELMRDFTIVPQAGCGDGDVACCNN